MIQYGSCPKGCGAQVAYVEPDPVALDRDDFTPHVCAEIPASAVPPVPPVILDARPLADQLQREGDRMLAALEREQSARGDGETWARENKLQQAARLIIEALGEDPKRDGLLDTPKRFAKMWQQFLKGVEGDQDYMRTFDHQGTNQMVVVSDLRVWSMCEHHLLPFWMVVAVGYISRDRVIGLSKIGRIARHCAARLGMQERYVEQVADAITKVAGTDDVMVTASGEHLCMLSRGARMGHTMTSSAARGLFLEAGNAARNEFLHLTSNRRVSW